MTRMRTYRCRECRRERRECRRVMKFGNGNATRAGHTRRAVICLECIERLLEKAVPGERYVDSWSVEGLRNPTRGTTNGNVRGSSYDRRRRRAWLMEAYASNVEGFVRCYRCGRLLYNEDAGTPDWAQELIHEPVPLTVDRIIPGCQGGTYRRTNTRPACQPCNSETGGATRRKRS